MLNIDLYKQLLSVGIQKLELSLSSLKRSLQKCSAIGIKETYTFEETEAFDSLTSKFARTSDIFTQKVLRSIFIVLHEGTLGIVDMANRAEAMDLITDADTLLMIRDVRNQIAHEYEDSGLNSIYGQIFELSQALQADIEKVKQFALKRGWLSLE
jgi:hypothetical protein